MGLFDWFIENVAFLDIPLQNNLYTWSDFRDSPTFMRIDRLLTIKKVLDKKRTSLVSKSCKVIFLPHQLCGDSLHTE